MTVTIEEETPLGLKRDLRLILAPCQLGIMVAVDHLELYQPKSDAEENCRKDADDDIDSSGIPMRTPPLGGFVMKRSVCQAIR